MSSEPKVITITLDGKRILALSTIFALLISFASVYVSGFYITSQQGLPLHMASPAIINGTQVSFGGTTTVSAGTPFTANLTVIYAEAYFSPYGSYYASPYYYPPGGYYYFFPSYAEGGGYQWHQALLSVYNNNTFSPCQLIGNGGALTAGGTVTYNFTVQYGLDPGTYIFKFMVWSDWISAGGSRVADNSGQYIVVEVV